jgi:methylmalonyl-CoA/ethylmalonyl-CoA epimerase
MRITRINHIGVLASDMDKVLHLYEDVLGLRRRHEEIYQEKERLCFLAVGDTQLELVASVQPDSEGNRVISSQGEGIDHVAFEVEDIEEAIDELVAQGVPMLDVKPYAGAEGSRVAYLDVRGTFGVNIELVQRAARG